MEEYAEPVVLDGPEAVAAAFHSLDAAVEAFGGAVRRADGVVGEDFVVPHGECASERLDLYHVVFEAADDRLSNKTAASSGSSVR